MTQDKLAKYAKKVIEIISEFFLELLFIILFGYFLYCIIYDIKKTEKTRTEYVGTLHKVSTNTFEWAEEGNIMSIDYKIIVIDSCEYIISGYDYSQTMTHKGKCQ